MIRFAQQHVGKVLDYGCGSGEVVRAGLQHGLDIYGCECFYEGGHGTRESALDLLGSRILEMSDGRIPFPDSTFDCIVDNMVLEHVKDLDRVVGELSRVLKPGGAVLSVFPSREVLREGHCGVPLAHRFSRSRLGYYWLLCFRAVGFGYFTEGKTKRQWARDFQQWINNYCFYRSHAQVLAAFSHHGFSVTTREREYIKFRNLKLFTPWLLRRFGFAVLLSQKNTRPAAI